MLFLIIMLNINILLLCYMTDWLGFFIRMMLGKCLWNVWKNRVSVSWGKTIVRVLLPILS